MESENNSSYMDRTGMGLFPGLVLALFFVMLSMLALLLNAMWAALAVLGFLVCTAGVIVLIVLAVAGEDEDGGKLRNRIPGL